MNRFLFRSRSAKLSGFTLVELLVVMGIIAILAAVILGVSGPVINAAKRAKAANFATQIQTACLGYYTEYSVYPVPTTFAGSKDFFASDSDSTDWPNITEALCGNISPAAGTTGLTGLSVTNTRAIAFLQLRASDVSSATPGPADCPLNPVSFSTAYPYFNLGIDDDYSGIVGDTGTVPTSGGLTGIPNFSTSTQGSMATYVSPKGVTGGVIVWANCNTTTTTTKWNPNFFVHTF